MGFEDRKKEKSVLSLQQKGFVPEFKDVDNILIWQIWQ
jgi:hypothetical protein